MNSYLKETIICKICNFSIKQIIVKKKEKKSTMMKTANVPDLRPTLM